MKPLTLNQISKISVATKKRCKTVRDTDCYEAEFTDALLEAQVAQDKVEFDKMVQKYEKKFRDFKGKYYSERGKQICENISDELDVY